MKRGMNGPQREGKLSEGNLLNICVHYENQLFSFLNCGQLVLGLPFMYKYLFKLKTI